MFPPNEALNASRIQSELSKFVNFLKFIFLMLPAAEETVDLFYSVNLLLEYAYLYLQAVKCTLQNDIK